MSIFFFFSWQTPNRCCSRAFFSLRWWSLTDSKINKNVTSEAMTQNTKNQFKKKKRILDKFLVIAIAKHIIIDRVQANCLSFSQPNLILISVICINYNSYAKCRKKMMIINKITTSALSVLVIRSYCESHTNTVRIGGRAHAHAIRTRTLMKAAHIRLVGSFHGNDAWATCFSRISIQPRLIDFTDYCPFYKSLTATKNQQQYLIVWTIASSKSMQLR